VKALHAPDEPLTPGVLYVAVATLAGSVIARSRGLPTRLFLPPTLFLASANHFLPKTSANVSAYAGSLEDAYFPAFAEKHDIAKAHTAMTIARAREALGGARKSVEDGAVRVIDAIEQATGVKVSQALRWEKAAEASAAEHVSSAAKYLREQGDAGASKASEAKESAVNWGKVAEAAVADHVKANADLLRQEAQAAQAKIVESVKTSAARAEEAGKQAAAAATEDAAAAKEAVAAKAEDVKAEATQAKEEAKEEAKTVVKAVEEPKQPPKRLV
jgi:MICOS complex subunit MIC26